MASLLRLFFVFALVASSSLQAKDLGIHGQVYPIAEESILEVILKRASSLSAEQVRHLQLKINEHYTHLLQEPREVPGLTESTSERIYYVDPSVIAHENIFDHKGEIIVAKGTRVNPLEMSPLNKPLLFIDGSQQSHVAWAKKQEAQTIWILVKGSPTELEQTEQRPVYFDQFGSLVKRFKILRIPAKVTSEGLRLKIREVPLQEVAL